MKIYLRLLIIGITAITACDSSSAQSASRSKLVIEKVDGLPFAPPARSVLFWGSHESGRSEIPTEASIDVATIAAGTYHTVVLKKGGGVIAWGDNSSGQTTVPTAAQSGIVAIAAGRFHTVALTENGRVLAWGRNDFGQTSVPFGSHRS